MANETKPAGTSVSVRRTELPAPDLADPNRKIIQVQYQAGELPPRFLYIPKSEWTKEKETAAIKADMSKAINPPAETLII